VRVLEDREPCHQPRRQRRMSDLVGIDRAEPLLEEAPVDRPTELRQRVVHVDDLIEPRLVDAMTCQSAETPQKSGLPGYFTDDEPSQNVTFVRRPNTNSFLIRCVGSFGLAIPMAGLMKYCTSG
jgi:hypothetical protein